MVLFLGMSDRLNEDLSSLKIERTEDLGKRRPKWTVIVGIGLACIVVAVGVAFIPSAGLSILSPKAREVEVAMVVRQSPSAENVALTAGGYIIPRVKVDVSSKTSGRVEQLLVDKGDRVTAGQVLARLDSEEILAQLAQARASKAAAEARLQEAVAGSRPQEVERDQAAVDQAEANVVTTRTNLDRALDLNRKGVLAKQALDDAQNAYQVACAQLKVARQNYELTRLGPRKEQIELARAQAAEADAAIRWWGTQLDNTVIRAPISGTILDRLVEKGEMVTTGYVSGRGAKSAFVTIADLKDLEVEMDINESDIPRVYMGQACVVSPDSYPDLKYRGCVREIAPEANRQKATIQVKVSIFDPDEYLRPETNAKVAFMQAISSADGPAPNQILVPKQAVAPGPAVFLFDDGKAEKRPIRTGREQGGEIEVLSGLAGGERLIVGSLEGLGEGERVRMVQGPRTAVQGQKP